MHICLQPMLAERCIQQGALWPAAQPLFLKSCMSLADCLQVHVRHAGLLKTLLTWESLTELAGVHQLSVACSSPRSRLLFILRLHRI